MTIDQVTPSEAIRWMGIAKDRAKTIERLAARVFQLEAELARNRNDDGVVESARGPALVVCACIAFAIVFLGGYMLGRLGEY